MPNLHAKIEPKEKSPDQILDIVASQIPETKNSITQAVMEENKAIFAEIRKVHNLSKHPDFTAKDGESPVAGTLFAKA